IEWRWNSKCWSDIFWPRQFRPESKPERRNESDRKCDHVQRDQFLHWFPTKITKNTRSARENRARHKVYKFSSCTSGPSWLNFSEDANSRDWWCWFHRVASCRKITRGWARSRHPRRLQRFLRSADQACKHCRFRQRRGRSPCRSSGQRLGAKFISSRKI